MALETVKKQFGKARVCREGQNQVFCEEVREFVHESRKNQTLYSNFEGYHERVVGSDDSTTLHNLVFLTLSNGKDRSSLTRFEFSETDKLTKMMVNKILNSNARLKCSKIRFQVVWIYYFDYLENEMKSVPAFKLYKKDQGSEALYIDTTVTAYDNWDHFIMFAAFPVSFICVPRSGEYTFRSIDGEELLDLEYICKNSVLLHGNIIQKSIRPFSQALIKRKLLKVGPCLRSLRHCVGSAVHFATLFHFHIHPTGRYVVAFFSVVGICLKLLEMVLEKKLSHLEALESTAADYGLMLLNDNGDKPHSWLKCLNQISDPIERPVRDKTLVDFVKLMKNPRENFVEILKYLPSLCDVCELFYVTLIGTNGAEKCHPDTQNWIRFFEFLSLLSGKISGKGNIKEIGSEESASVLRNLEKYSCEKVVADIEASARSSMGKELSESPLDVSGPQQFGLDLFGFRVCLLLQHTGLDCKGFLQKLLKSNYTLLNSPFFQEILIDGKSIGVVIPFSFKSRDHAIVAVHLDKLPK